MRDLLFVITFVILIYYCFKKPYIGITLWLWISLFYPKGWVYGFAENIRYNLIIVVITIFSYILHKDKDPKNFGSLSWLILIFLLWTTISSIFTISTPSLVWAEWFEFFKICLLYFFAIATIRTKNHLDTLIWGVALSLGVFSSLQGARFILSGGGHILSGMGGHTLGDRNDLSVAIILMIPLLVYLAHTTKQKIIKLSLFAMIILSVTAVLGSGSRGGFIGVSIVAAYFWINSNHKIISLALLLILGVVTIGFMPDSWHDRMSTIESAGEDLSFLGRIMAWKQAFIMASENFTGGGFKAGQMNHLWFMYDPQHNLNWLFDTSNVYFPKAYAAHSIYFQVLGDHGFFGLFIFLFILLVAFAQARHVQKKIKKNPELKDLAVLSSMVRVSLLAFGVSGAAVSMAYFDLLYALFAVIYVLNSISEKSSIQKQVINQQQTQEGYVGR